MGGLPKKNPKDREGRGEEFSHWRVVRHPSGAETMTSLSAIESIFSGALEKATPEEREAFLDEACRQDPELKARVQRLLAAHDKAGKSFLEPPAGVVSATIDRPAAARVLAEHSADLVGSSLGPYKLLEVIGQGGMGVVYMAEQQAPLRRRVALKVIKPGMDTRQVAARFEAERQALALMDHPNIARVLDAGASASGQPYFVMELVRGIPLTDYCDQNNLPVHQRLELVLQVCRAVQHAHQKGIIHRDIKPTNVLVTLHDGRPVPKVIDFGVAKALHQPLTEKTLFTGFAQMIGTPLYMSPEQAELSGMDVDTRADVYSLGVLLYELLTGTTPFEKQRFQAAALDEVRRIIREEEPAWPSTRISTLGERRTAIAAHRQADPHRLREMVRGELDWIVMKTLEKDRTRRYETVDRLAQDIQNYLADLPVEAGPPAKLYRLRKLARRHRRSLTMGLVLLSTVLAGSAASVWQAVRATRAEHGAETARAQEVRARKLEHEAKKVAQEQAAEAERQRAKAEQWLYGAQVNLAHAYWDSNEAGMTWDALEKCAPQFRGWEHDYVYSELTRDHVVVLEGAGWCSFSPSRDRIFAVSNDELVIRDGRSGERLRTILPGKDEFSAHAVNPRDGQVVTGTTNGLMRVWDTDSGSELFSFQAHDAPVACVAFNPDGSRIATAPQSPTGGAIRLWDAATGRELGKLEGHAAEFHGLAFGPAGETLVSGDKAGNVRRWDVKTGSLRQELQVGGQDFNALALVLSTDGRFAFVNKGKQGIIWNLESGTQISSLSLDSNWANAAFAPDNALLAVSDYPVIRIIDVTSGKCQDVLRGQLDLGFSLAFSSDGSRLVSCDDLALMIWDMQRRQQRFAIDQRPGASPHNIQETGQVFFTSDGRHLITSMNREAVSWEIASKQRQVEYERDVASMAMSPDGSRLVTATHAGAVKVWDTRSGRELITLSDKFEPGRNDLQYSPDGRFIACVDEGRVTAWDVLTGAETRSIACENRPRAIAFTSNADRLFIANLVDRIVTLDLRDTAKTTPLPLDEADTVYSMVVLPDGRHLAIGSYPDVILLDTQTGKLERALAGHTEPVNCLAVSPDGRRLVSGSDDKTIRVWDPDNGLELLTLRAGGQVASIAFSPDGRTIASVSTEVGVELWEATHSMPASPVPQVGAAPHAGP